MPKKTARKKKKPPRQTKLLCEKRDSELYKIYVESQLDHAQALRSIWETGVISRARLYVIADKANWRRKKQLYQEDLRAQEEEKRVLSIANDVTRDIPLSTMVSKMKEFAWKMLNTAGDIASTSTLMINHYSRKIADIIARAGGIHNLTASQADEIEVYAKNMERYKRQLDEFIKPSALITMLRTVGIETAVDPGNPEGTALTIFDLQAALPELRKKIDAMSDEDIERDLLQGIDLPDIEDKSMSEMLAAKDLVASQATRQNVDDTLKDL